MKRYRIHRGFTLVEILIVVIIVGVLGGIVVPQFSNAGTESSEACFVANLRAFVKAARVFRIRTGSYPEDSSSGVCPSGLEDYVSLAQWEGGTPLGGVWDAELNSFGYTSSIGVHFRNDVGKDDLYMTEVDSLFDDGNLSTGGFRKIAADRYYYIVCH